jgi:ubiquinone/menaquinone biosynthesis C-methylase UbiE
MSVFDGLALSYDLGMLPLEWLVLRRLRRRAFSRLEGQVLELGLGSGLNLPHYSPGTQVVGVDASLPMLRVAARRRTAARVCRVQADVHHLPFASGAFSTVTAALLFCSVAEPARALAEVRRVLRPAGRLVLIEHTRGRGLGAWLTDRLHPLWFAWNGVCHLNRETTQAVLAAGFQLVREESRFLGIFRMIEAVYSV